MSDADLAASDAVGTWLLRNLGTRGARGPKGAPIAAVELRNRVATLLARDYDEATVIAHYFLGSSYAEAAPALMSRFVPRRTMATSPDPTSPTPVPAPAPAPGTPAASSAPVTPAPSPVPIAAPAAPAPAPANGAPPAPQA